MDSFDPSPAAPKRGGARAVLPALFFLAAGAALGVLYQMRQGEEFPATGAADSVSDQFVHNGYCPLTETMEAAGYRRASGARHAFEKNDAGKPAVTIAFDFKAGVCRKNRYVFDMTGKWLESGGEFFVHRTLAEKVLNRRLEKDAAGVLRAAEIRYAPHEWLAAFPPLIAHAGGIYRTPRENLEYTNTVAALIQNYDAGHRVFEFDFQITSDGKLAAVHAGFVPGKDGRSIDMSSGEWLAHKGFGGLQTALAEDILDEMLVNADMFVVTDTKWSGNDAFKILHAEAVKRDPALLDRIIPQIYNRDMYDGVMEVHAFPSVIFTTYATRESPMDIVDFCAGKDNIRVITTPVVNGSVDVVLAKLAETKKLVLYTHTPNRFSEIAYYRNQGVRGFYTDYLTPADLALYERSASSPKK